MPARALRLEPLEPGGDGVGNLLTDCAVHCFVALEGVGDADAEPVAEQKGFAACGGVERLNLVEVVLLHDDDEVCPTDQGNVDLLRMVGVEGDALFAGDPPGARVGGVTN